MDKEANEREKKLLHEAKQQSRKLDLLLAQSKRQTEQLKELEDSQEQLKKFVNGSGAIGNIINPLEIYKLDNSHDNEDTFNNQLPLLEAFFVMLYPNLNDDDITTNLLIKLIKKVYFKKNIKTVQSSKVKVLLEILDMMPSNTPDSHKISLKVIEAIKQHPVLYVSDVKGNAIKLQEFRQKVWKRISDELGLDPKQNISAGWVKLKWKNLRDTYCRILKYKNKSSKGIRRKKWIFEDHLSFLKFPYEPNYEAQYVELTEEYINDINREIINSQDLLEQLEDDVDDDYREYLEILEEDTSIEESQTQESFENNNDTVSPETSDNQALQKLAIDAYAKQIQSKFRKIRPKEARLEETNNVSTFTPILLKAPSIISVQKPVIAQNVQNVEKVVKVQSQKKSFDQNQSVDQFFLNIAQAVKNLPPKAQADIKMDVCRIVSEAEILYSKQSIPETVKKYTNMPGMIPKLVLVPCKIIDNQHQNC